MREAAQRPHRVWRNGAWQDGLRDIAEETPVALTYDGATHVVMMATPSHLEDFAVGFSLTEGIIHAPDDIEALEIMPLEAGVDVRMWLRGPAGAALTDRRRQIVGPVGCGMCGLASLQQANRALPRVDSALCVGPQVVMAAIAALAPAQLLNRRTRAVHAAGFWQPGRGLLATREDVGRHNALGKLVGTLARNGVSAGSGLVLLSSRLSVEMVQKAAMIGAPLVVAISAPTGLAIQAADAAGITLVGVARDDGFEVFTRPDRID